MKMKFSLLYKNGFEEDHTLNVSEENARKIESIIQVVEQSFLEDIPAHITLGDGESLGVHVRVSDLSRLKMTVVDEVTQ